MTGQLIKVLVVEDDTDDFLILKVMLSGLKNTKFELDRVTSYDIAMHKMEQGCHDVCLLDYRLEGKNGLDFLKEANRKGCLTPVIFFTGQGDYDVDMKAMQLGAADYLSKNKIDKDMLERSIRFAVERRKAEEQLRRSEEFFRAVLQNALDGVSILEPDGNIRYASPSLKTILGFDPVEKTNSSFFEMVHPEDVPRVKEFLGKLLYSPGLVLSDEFQARHKDGSWKVLEMAGKSHSFTNPDFRGVVVNYRDVTERKTAERATSRLAAIVESSEDAVYSVSLEGVILSWNPGAVRIYGYKPEEIGGRDLSLIIPVESRDEFNRFIKAAGEGTPISNFLTSHRTKKGGEVLLSLTISPIKNIGGKVFGASIIARDITERERTKVVKDMLESERDQLLERLLLQMQNMPIACVLSDQNFHFTYWNPAAERLFGYSFSEVEGKGAKETIVPNRGQWTHIEQAHDLVGKSTGSLQGEIWEHRRKDGKNILCEWYSTPLRDADGKLIGSMGMALDVTERQKAEAVQTQLAAILQQTPDAVIGSDLDNLIFSWNRGAEVLFGYTFDEIVSQPQAILAPEDRKHESDEMRAIVMAGESISNFETVRMKKNGDWVDVSITLSPILDTKGKIVGVSSITRDISERKRAEESLKKHEEQMRLAQKMDAIGRLAGGVAHDFNNLLSVIGGNAEFLLGSLEQTNPHREELEEIQKAVRRGAELTKQLLVFGQKQVVQPQPVNLNELSTEMSKMLKRLIDATVDLSIIQDKDIQFILADQGQMQQVILNLVLNARDAMPKGGNIIVETKHVPSKNLELEQRPTLPPGSYVRLSVTDTGTGMTPEIQKHIFEPFFTTKAGKGTGLGLATVYGIVTKWSGHIFLHSTPGMGTTFTFYFPALPPVSAPKPKAKQIALIPQGSETVLIAEDEDPVRKVLVRTLEKYGYRVLEASNGIEAVQKAWSFEDPIHLLLTDTIMPKMNGKELADEIKKTRPKTKVVFVSGYPREVLSQQGILDMGIHLIQKPFELEDLVRQIRKVLDEK